MKKVCLIMLLSLVIIYGCTTPTDVSNKNMPDTSVGSPSYLHSTNLFEIEEVDKINDFYPGYLISVNKKFLPSEFKEIKFKKTSSHKFDLSPNGVYIHDSVGSGNYGNYDFLIIYQDLPVSYDVQEIIPLSLNLDQQNNDYTLYSYDGFYSDMKNNRYSGKIITFIHNNKKAFILVGKLNFITSTKYELKEYYNLP